jgi:glycosyltransferase involved in cell wall biosynthesis
MKTVQMSAHARPRSQPYAAGGRPLVYVTGLDPAAYVNGHVSYVEAHARAAIDIGFSPHLFCLGTSAGVEDTELGTIHRVTTPVRHYLLSPAYRRPLARAVAEYLIGCRHPPPYGVHGFGPWAGAAAEASQAVTARGLPTVAVASAYTTVLHEWRGHLAGLAGYHSTQQIWRYRAWYPWVRSGASRLERHGYERSRLLLVNYASVERLLRETVDPRLDIRRLPYATPAAFAAPAREADRAAAVPATLQALEPADAPLILSVSRHVARKGLDLLLRALALLARAGVGFRACLAGDGRLLPDHRRLTAELGLSGRVALPGHVSDVAPYLGRADIFVLPSVEEGSGSMAVLEALQSGTAIVASDVDGIGEDLVDGRQALLVEPGNARALADALARLLADAQLRAALATDARALYLDRFSAERFTGALREVYAEVGVVP